MIRQSLSLRLFTPVLILLFLSGCQPHDKKAPPPADQRPAAKVQIFAVDAVSTPDRVEIMGTVQAAKKADISSRISGNIIEITVAPGSQVKKDDTLVEINAGEISAQLLQAKAELDQADRNLKRERKLLAQKAATPEAVKALEDIYKIAQASFKEARIMLSYTTISAPFDGQITKKLVDVGELATQGKILLHLEDQKHLQVIADVPETIAQNLSLGMTMQVKIPTAQLNTVGTVSEIAPTADALTRTVPIKLDINKTPAVRSGQFARVTLPGENVETLIVPQESIIPIGQLERVFIAIDTRARLRLVRTGKKYPQGVEILSGLSPGDKLITVGADKITDGQRISIQ